MAIIVGDTKQQQPKPSFFIAYDDVVNCGWSIRSEGRDRIPFMEKMVDVMEIQMESIENQKQK